MPLLPGADSEPLSPLTEYLQEITEALAATGTQREVIEIILTPAVEALGAVAGIVLLIDQDDQQLKIAGSQGYEDITRTIWQEGALQDNQLVADILRIRQALYFEHAGTLKTAYPEIESRTGGLAAVANALLPMFLDKQPLGVIVLDFGEPHDFTPAERRFLKILSNQCAVALGRTQATQLLEAHVTERTQQLEERTRQLEEEQAALEIFVAFTEAVGSETDVQALVRQAITLLVDTCGVDVTYVEREDELFKPSAWSPDYDPTLLRLLDRGFPLQHSAIAKVLLQKSTAFIDHWNTTWLFIEESGIFQALAGHPYFVAGELQSVLLIGSRTSATWSERHKKIFRAVGRSLDLSLERAATARQLEAQNAELHAQTLALEGMAELTRDLSLPGGPKQLIVQVMDLMRSLLPPGYASYWEIKEGKWRVTAHRGNVGRPEWQAARERGFPVGQFPTLDLPWQTRQPYFQGHYNPGHDAVPELMDHLISIATLPVMIRGEVVGVFGLGQFGHRDWGAADRALLATAIHSLGLGLERAEQLQQLEAESAARAAFTAFTEAVGSQTDVWVLAQQAIAVLRRRFPQASVGYYEREGELWKARVWSSDVRQDVEAVIRAGLPTETPMIVQMLDAGQAVFLDAWDPQREQLGSSEEYSRVGNVPLLVDGEVRAMLSVAFKSVQPWSEPAKGLVQAVGRALTLALERSETARHLEAQNAELLARTQALEGFARLTQHLSLEAEPAVLIGAALKMALSLLPPGYAAFWEPHDGLWRATVQAGDVGDAALQAVISAGLPVDRTPTLDTPRRTQQPFYQDVYLQGLDTAPEVVSHVNAVATLPVLVRSEVLGVLNVPLFEARHWNAADRAVMETTAHSLGLALERAEQARQLTAQRDMLQATNEELEAFTYSVSHDLRTPVRHILSFGGLLRRVLPETLDERAQRYFSVIEAAAVNLNQLIDGMLELSRTSRQTLQQESVELGHLVESVRSELSARHPMRLIRWQVSSLPTVMGDTALLRRVVAALLENAVKYTRTREEALIEVWAEDRHDTWAVLVRDNGVGFDPRYQDKLFTVFQRLHRQEDFEGAAISLANARRIVARHGGVMIAEGQLDGGATFSFVLPKKTSTP